MHEQRAENYRELIQRTGNAILAVKSADAHKLHDHFSRFDGVFNSPEFGTIFVAETSKPWLFDFHLHSSTSEEKHIVVPRMVANFETIMSGSHNDATSEMARTMFLVSQYPDQGYERSMEDVYNQALDLQAEFLDKAQIEGVVNDPRVINRSKLLEDLLASKFFQIDPSFEDYSQVLLQQGIDNNKATGYAWTLMDRSESNIKSFLVAREIVRNSIVDREFQIQNRQTLRDNMTERVTIIAGLLKQHNKL